MKFLTFDEFLQVVAIHKERQTSLDRDNDLIDAFVACGGSFNREGFVSTNKLKNIISDMGLAVDIDSLIKMADRTDSEKIDFRSSRRY